MEADWTQPIIIVASIFAVFLWLRNDIKNTRDEIQKLRDDMGDDMQQLRDDMREDMNQLRVDFQRLERKVDGLDTRLRAVESEQSRVAGLLEGLGLAGALPGDER